MALLEDLDRVRWHKVSHAYGVATDVPDLLRALVDPDHASKKVRTGAERTNREIRDHVIHTLYGSVFHQGTVWQASPHVVPFLVEILRDGPPDPALRASLLEYLHHLALGYSEDWFPAMIDPAIYFLAADAPPLDPRDRHDPSRMAGYARDCYRTVEAALPTLAPFVHDADRGVAFAAVGLLGSFRAEASITALRDAAARPGTSQAVALVALARLDPAAIPALAAPLLAAGASAGGASSDRFAAVHAAAALRLADPAHADSATIDVLVHPLGELTELKTPLAGSIGTLVARSLERVPPPHRDRAVRALGDILALAARLTNLSTTAALLTLTFGDEPAPPRADTLTPPQRRALELILAHGAFKIGNAAFGNYRELLTERGVPRDAAKLRAWLVGAPERGSD